MTLCPSWHWLCVGTDPMAPYLFSHHASRVRHRYRGAHLQRCRLRADVTAAILPTNLELDGTVQAGTVGFVNKQFGFVILKVA